MAKATKATRSSGPKKLSPYNKFMKDQLPKYKANNPGKNHKDAFKAVAQLWKDSPENPKNKA
ncbi:hypothetical protein K502DRAFT_362820 [Neoconidiobolus thromboides FSU 785]|nr:hypothetical protein K502DRAFT_362820 [Neoconidiobolus thromboides FSU 785]